MVSRVWYVWRVGAALARLDLQRRTLDRAFLQATFRLAMVEGLTPEETAALVFWQMPATLRSDGALLLLRDWRRAGRIDAERHQGFVAFAAGAPYAQVFPAARRRRPEHVRAARTNAAALHPRSSRTAVPRPP
jgi:hypothetical protein